MKAVLCPVCVGVGKVSGGFYNQGGDFPYWVESATGPEICRGCAGKGWVEVGGNSDVPCYCTPLPVNALGIHSATELPTNNRTTTQPPCTRKDD